MLDSYAVLIGSERQPGGGWVHWPRASALLRAPYDTMALKARLDCGDAAASDLADVRLAGRVALSTPEQGTAALRLARRAGGEWRRVPLERRLAFVEAVYDAMCERADDVVDVLVAEGHPVRVARWELTVVLSMIHPESLVHARQTLEWCTEWAGRRVSLVRKPDGVVGLNAARNAGFLSSALGALVLAAGNALIVNAPPTAPLAVAFLYHELVAPLLDRHGAPPGTLGVLCAPSRPTVKQWLESPDCDDIFYYGPARHGARLEAECLEHGKKPVLELSGNDAMVVWRDADLEGAATAAAERYFGSGQLCIAPKFVVVHPEVADEFTTLLHHRVAGLRVGPPEDPDVVLSAVVKRGDCLDVLRDAVEQGAEHLCGGELVDVYDKVTSRGPFVRPVLLRVHGLATARRMGAVRDETFFPLMCVVVPDRATPEHLLAEILEFVDSNRYGLRNSLWARDPHVIERFCDIGNGGVLKVNDSHVGCLPALPTVGGTGLSGGTFGEANLPYLRTTRLQGISVTVDPSRTRVFDHQAAVRAVTGPPGAHRRPGSTEHGTNDEGERTHMTTDALLDQKIDTCFGHIDADGNGSLDREDLFTLGARLLAAFGEAATSPKGTRLMNGMVTFWDAVAAAADADGDGRLTPEEYRTGMKGAFITSGEGFSQAFRPMLEAVCLLLDTDGDGGVDEKEFQVWQEVFRTAPQDRAAAFRALDTDGSGRLTVDELLTAMRQYYTSNDPSAPGNVLYGPLN
ncbi:N-succinylglutamate 5-semialdehyde dehydrogenase [Streptomyces sp. RB5]|uniref:N-succinylglutamate 5-semialdehyde dehydrogenase n=1 Tax=Streptomyces smaragdinus TaxID=2585196 RepID=A0A7K0CBM2_9ACTN|nr:aldehyde dehydrogenase family protein [Streptomyces smaragdinus]MQY10857.1 N-succinylglutamate 5-semialdehyde dehydrogenase [Streptomyces smaragdinus]